MHEELPHFYEWIEEWRRAYPNSTFAAPDSSGHAIRWILIYLEQGKGIEELLQAHARVPLDLMWEGTPRLLALFDPLPSLERHTWKSAVALLCLLLIVAACEREERLPTELIPSRDSSPT
ncbi:MAG: hypothetical protein H0T73_19965 [Ardenticatenales bacterium]|nr:hypothetical protein [Ardenticatenales bacterium]